jgi:nucleoside-diphosphate-sugar epimerase
MNNTTNNTILVIGSTGKTGKRVADQLEARGVPVRHGSRSANIPFDWENPQTWAPALAGVDKVYITYYRCRRVCPDRSTQSASSARG